MKASAPKKRPYPHFKFPEEIIIETIELSPEQCQWYGLKKGSYQLKCTNYSWFPKDCIMGVVNRMYEDTYNVGAQIRGNLGSMSIAVTDLQKAVRLLKEKGFQIV